MGDRRHSVRIRGEGIAAYCCTHLLRSAGFRVAVERCERPKVPAIMLSEAAMALIGDVFGRTDLFGELPRIQRRVVAWGANSRPVAVPHSAVVISEESLLGRIRSGLRPGEECAPEDAEWTIYAAHPLPPESREQRFGSRMASAVPVTLKDTGDPATTWVESLDAGWLFAIPTGVCAGWILSVGGPLESALAGSRVIAKQIVSYGSASGEFPAYPRISTPLCGPGWLACGTAALAFDPLCGDGTAHAVREAILASAIIRAAAEGAPIEELLSHYQVRLMAGLLRHLALCDEFYRSGHGGPWWDSELAAMRGGVEWCQKQIGSQPVFRYRLNGFELQALTAESPGIFSNIT